MKKNFVIALLVIAMGATFFASCTSSRGGCKATQGMIGYK